MNRTLQTMIDEGSIGFEDIFEAYAQLCINNVRDINQDMIHDEGVAVLVNQGMDLSVEGLTTQAIDWALVCTPEMIGDIVEGEPKLNESWLQFVLRAYVEKRVKDTKAFNIKFS